MKINKIREMSSPDLEKELGELKSELFKLRFSLATHGLDNPMKIKEVKKDIARINTILTQRKLEEKAFQIGQGSIPVQLWKDFKENQISTAFVNVTPQIKGAYRFGNLRQLLPESLSNSLLEAIPEFGKKIHGFDREDFILAGIESRTSSPVRMNRDENLESNIKGIYPCGEGAGYAGGITTAAIDGIKVAEEIIKKYKKF